jgi:hypothetical protein
MEDGGGGMTRPTWVIDEATDGVPSHAHCERCGFGWRRPDDDPRADTLPRVARGHLCYDDAAAGGDRPGG